MELAKLSDQEILRIADPMMDNLMEGSTEINYEKHIRDFTERLKTVVTKEHLEQVCKRYQNEWGYFSERRFIAIFRKKNSVAVIWKQRFTKTPDEFIAEMVLVQDGARFLVDHAFVH